jgi:hypothetical protein
MKKEYSDVLFDSFGDEPLSLSDYMDSDSQSPSSLLEDCDEELTQVNLHFSNDATPLALEHSQLRSKCHKIGAYTSRKI